MKIIEITKKDRPEILKLLLHLWEASTEVSHTFLLKEDIESIKPEVEKEILRVEWLIVLTEIDEILGFMGGDINKIELLFISSTSLHKGFGTKLVEYATKEFGVKYVDVNLDNTNALNFYEKMGFKTYSFSPYDDMGNPFPILRMKRD